MLVLGLPHGLLGVLLCTSLGYTLWEMAVTWLHITWLQGDDDGSKYLVIYQWTGTLVLIFSFLRFSEHAETPLSSVQFSLSVVSNSLRPHELQHTSLPVHHQLPEFTQTHVHRVGDAIQPSHPLSSPSPPAPNPSQHQSLFQWVSSSHEVAKVLEFQL